MRNALLRRGRIVRLSAGLTILAAAAACDDSTGPDTMRDVASVVVTPDARTFTAINDSARLAAEAKNASGGTISGTTFVWSSLENNIASVDKTGMVKAKAVGTARIVASASGRSDTAAITVTQAVAHVVLTPEADTINAIGDVVGFTAVVTDANDVPLTNPPITWSTTTPAIVSVVGGNVTSLATGNAVVIATSGAAADTVAVLSRQIAASLSVTPSPLVLMAGETQQLSVTAADSNGVAIPASAITWSSASQAIATVSGTGVVRGETAGGTTVMASAPGRSVEVPVTVQPGAPTGPLSWSIPHRGLVVEGNEPLAVMGRASNDVFAVGPAGGIYRYDGARWTLHGASGIPSSTRVNGFWGSSSASIWAVGNDSRLDPITFRPIQSGRVFRTTGTTWTTQYVGQDHVTSFVDVSATSDTDVWVSGTQIFHYDGSAWTASLVPGSGVLFTAIWAASPSSVFAGTDNGAIWQYDGANWTEGAASNGYRVTDIWGSAPSDIWVVDDGGFVRRWNGTAWQQSTRFSAGLSAVRGTSATNVWVGGGNVLAQWNGTIWFSLDPATTALGSGVRGVWLSSPTTGWLVTSSGMFSELRTEGWTPHWDSPTAFTDIAGIGSDLWVCGLAGTVQHLSAGSWRTERLPRSEGCASITASSPTNVLAGGATPGGATPIYYRYDGATWSVNPTGALARFVDLWTTSGGETYAALVVGTVVYRFDGASWIAMPTGSPQNLRSVWASGPNDIFASGDQGTVMHYDGTSWTKLATGTTATLNSVWGSSSSNVFFAGSDASGGIVLRYNGAGFTSANPTTRALLAIHGRSPNEVYAVGDGGTIVRFDGSAWSHETTGVTDALLDVWASPAGDVYVVGVQSLVLRGTR